MRRPRPLRATAWRRSETCATRTERPSSRTPPGTPSSCASPNGYAGGALAPIDRTRELGLRHLRAALDVLVLRLFVELVARPPAGALPVRAQPAATAGRDVLAG